MLIAPKGHTHRHKHTRTHIHTHTRTLKTFLQIQNLLPDARSFSVKFWKRAYFEILGIKRLIYF